MIARRQLLELGFTPKSIKHRVAGGRLHPVWRGVYAVGRPALTPHGRWMAAVLSCGPEAVLCHLCAAAIWEICPAGNDAVDGIVVHRRSLVAGEAAHRHGIPVTSPICTLIDIATQLERDPLEAAINEADKFGLTDSEELRSSLDEMARRPGVKRLRELLDRRTFTLTDSQLERRFLPLVRSAGLPLPETGCLVNGFKVDFYWPRLGLVVETDGLRYHRTPAEQARDRIRDQVHAAAGLTPLRFTRAQVRFEPDHVRATLAAVAARGGPRRRRGGPARSRR